MRMFFFRDVSKTTYSARRLRLPVGVVATTAFRITIEPFGRPSACASYKVFKSL